MLKSNVNFHLFPRYDVVSPIKLFIFKEEKIFLHHFFENIFKYLPSATSIVKILSLMEQIGPDKGQIFVLFKVKIKEINVTFKGILVFGI